MTEPLPEQGFAARDDPVAPAVGTIDVIGQSAPVYQSCTHTICAFIEVLVLFDFGGQYRVCFGELHEPINVGLIECIPDDQVSALMKRGELLR
jgi:hypothetical protein